jgi:hypothetical protein
LRQLDGEHRPEQRCRRLRLGGFPNPGVYYVRVSEKTGTQTGPYTVMVANMSQWLTLDIDGSAPLTQYDALTDGLMIVRT